MVRAVFLDRDGVINRSIVRGGKPCAPSSQAEVEILPGVAEALARLRAAGFLNVVVTNQPDVGAGSITRAAVEAIHADMQTRLALDAIRACYHTEADGCACRKPKPGMLLDAAAALGIELGASYMVGDRWRDVGAGKAAGCKVFFIDYQYGEQRPEMPFVSVKSLAHAVDLILRKETP